MSSVSYQLHSPNQPILAAHLTILGAVELSGFVIKMSSLPDEMCRHSR